jgi:hypothetical protein
VFDGRFGRGVRAILVASIEFVRRSVRMKPFDWDRNWRSAGIQFAVLAIIASVIYGSVPKLDASADKLVSFYDGDRTRILIATVFFALSLLEGLWFAAALSSVLRDAGKGGWGAAAIASAAAMGALLFMRITVRAALAYTIAGSGYNQLTYGLSALSWVLTVLWFFPAAMFVMSGAFGLWRAGIISKRFFSVGVAAVVLALLGGTTWATDGFWAPDGAYALVAQVVVFLWIAVLSGFLVRRSSTVSTHAAVAVPAA